MIKDLNKLDVIITITLLISIILYGCFIFPLSGQLISSIICYGIIGIGFSKIFQKNKAIIVFFLTLFFTYAGMLCRFFLDYGDISVFINFTSFNILIFIILVPIYCTIIFRSRFKKDKTEEINLL